MSTYLPQARFPRLERQGWMFGLSGGQVGVLGCATALLLQAALGQDFGNILLRIAFPVAPLVAFGTISRRRRPLTTITLEMAVWQMRRLFGHTKWKARPEAPIEEHSFGVPGAFGTRITVHSSAFDGGALLWDSRAGTATAVIRCESTSFTLASPDDRAGRTAGFAKLCAQVARHEGISRVATYARTVPAARAAASDYYERTIAQRGAGAEASPWADAQYREFLAQGHSTHVDAGVVSRDTLVALTIDVSKIRHLVKAAGGGQRGTSLVMAREVAALGRMLDGAGARSVKWLNAEEVAEVIRVAYDPGAVDAIEQRRAGGVTPVSVAAAGPTVIHEEVNRLVTDTGLHQVYWVAEWPRTVVEMGFLASLLCRGTYAHTFTQVFTPVPLHKAMKSVQDGKLAIQSQRTVAAKLQRPVSAELDATAMDIAEREQELVQGFGDVQYTAYLTVSAPTEDALGAAKAEAEMAANQLDLRLLRRQQGAAFTAANLPVGWGLK